MQQTIHETQSTQLPPEYPSTLPTRTSNPEEEEVRALKEHCVSLVSKVQEFRRQNNQLRKEIRRLKNVESLYLALQANQQTLKNDLAFDKWECEQRVEILTKEKQNFIQQTKKTSDEIQAKMSRLQSTISEIQRQKTKTQQTLDDALAQNKTLQMELKKKDKTITELSAEKNQLQQELQNIEDELSRSQIILLQTKEDQKQLQAAQNVFRGFQEILHLPLLEHLQQPHQKVFLCEKVLRSVCFPGSEILSYCDFAKLGFLHQNITKFFGVPSYKTRLAFKYDSLNPNNFHLYFDDIPNLMILAHLQTGAIIGGITEFPYQKESTKKPGNGFLFSLTAQRIFNIRKDAKNPVANYDDKFLSFGNSQLRIKTGQKVLFSNFGKGTSTFETEGFSRKQFLQLQEGNEVEMVSFELYAIELQKNTE